MEHEVSRSGIKTLEEIQPATISVREHIHRRFAGRWNHCPAVSLAFSFEQLPTFCDRVLLRLVNAPRRQANQQHAHKEIQKVDAYEPYRAEGGTSAKSQAGQ